MKNDVPTTGLEIINFVMQYSDDEFITQSYKFVLHRRVDNGGLTNYRKVLYKYESKAKVLLDILSSKEGRSNLHWTEMVAAVRQIRRKELLQKIGISASWNFFRRISTDGYKVAFTRTLHSSDSGTSLLGFRNGASSSQIESINGRDLSGFRNSHSPRALTIAYILASTERT